MNEFEQSIARSRESVLQSNKVLKNTYLLLSLALGFSAAMVMLSVALNVPPMGYWIAMIAAFLVLFFVLPRYENSSGIGGIVSVFLFTGLLGFAIGPIIGSVLALEKGSTIVSTALGGTAVIFLALSGYALTTKKDFSFIGGFLFAGLIIVFIASILNLFMNIAGLALAINVVVMFIFSGLILFDTSRIIHGGEDNYIRATVSLFLSIYNIFLALLQLLLAFAGGND